MKSYNALIIRGNAALASEVRSTLTRFDVHVIAVVSSPQQLSDVLSEFQVDIILSDIEWEHGQRAYDFFAGFHREGVPLIYFTSRSDVAQYDAAMATEPASILVGPFDPLTLRNAVQNALSESTGTTGAPSVFVKKKGTLVRLPLREMLWVAAEGNYCHIHCVSEQYVSKISLKRFCEKMDPAVIVRIHRNYAVNRSAIEQLDFRSNTLQVGDQQLPVGRSYKTSLRGMLDII